MKKENLILEYIQSNGNVLVKDISTFYGLSQPTIRRYLDKLELSGLVKRSHGSVEPIISSLMSFQARMHYKKSFKIKIAEKAATFIKNGQTIFIGGGSSTAHILPFLVKYDKLTVITNSLYVVNILAKYKNIATISTGGILYDVDNVFVGNFSKNIIEQLYADIVFLGAEGIHPVYGISKDIRLEELTEHLMLLRSTQRVVLASSDKIMCQYPLIVAPIENIDILVTDKFISKENTDLFLTTNIKLVTV